jgi:hypothetical protein
MIHISYKGSPYEKKQWTKPEIIKVISVWEAKTPDELQMMFGRPYGVINSLVKKLRQEGVRLKKKTTSTKYGLREMLREIASEL